MKHSIGDRFRDAKEAAGIKDKMVTFHSLRHSMATESLLGGARIYEVSKVLGHTTVDITSQFYAHTEGKNFYEPVNILADSFKE
jgi:site-specific recombinase XerD